MRWLRFTNKASGCSGLILAWLHLAKLTGVHSTVSAISPGGWPQAFVAKLRSQIRTEHQRQDEAVGCWYSRHFVIISRGGQSAKISWRDGKTYELTTAKMEAGNLQWRFMDMWRLAG